MIEFRRSGEDMVMSGREALESFDCDLSMITNE